MKIVGVAVQQYHRHVHGSERVRAEEEIDKSRRIGRAVGVPGVLQ